MPTKTKDAASQRGREAVLATIATVTTILLIALFTSSVVRATSHRDVPPLGSAADPISQSLFFKLSDGRVIECVVGGADSLACDFDHPVTLPSRL